MSDPEKGTERQSAAGTSAGASPGIISVRDILSSFSSLFSAFGYSNGRRLPSTQLEAVTPKSSPSMTAQSQPLAKALANTKSAVDSSALFKSINIADETSSGNKKKRRKHPNNKSVLSSSENTEERSSGLLDQEHSQQGEGCERNCDTIADSLYTSGVRVFCIVHDGNLKEVVLRIEKDSLTWSLKGSTQALAVPICKVDAIENGLPPKLSTLGWEAVQMRIFYIRIQGGKCATFMADSQRERSQFVLAIGNAISQQPFTG